MNVAHIPAPEVPPGNPDTPTPPVPPDQAPDVVPQEDPPKPGQPAGPPPLIAGAPGVVSGIVGSTRQALGVKAGVRQYSWRQRMTCTLQELRRCSAPVNTDSSRWCGKHTLAKVR